MKEHIDAFLARFAFHIKLGLYLLIITTFIRAVMSKTWWAWLLFVSAIGLAVAADWKANGWIYKEIYYAGSKQQFEQQRQAVKAALPFGMGFLMKDKEDKDESKRKGSGDAA